MTKEFSAKIFLNKKNVQINLNPKKKELNKDFLKSFKGNKNILIKDWELF